MPFELNADLSPQEIKVKRKERLKTCKDGIELKYGTDTNPDIIIQDFKYHESMFKQIEKAFLISYLKSK